MLQAQLREIIANGENSAVEFKRDDVRPEQLAREIVAMLNAYGGQVFLGVEDDGTVSGIQRPHLEEWIMDTVFGRYIHPMVLPFYEEVALAEGGRVAVISFAQGMAKPYVLRHHQREEIYIRVGSTSRLATREQQARLFQSGGMLHAEILPVSGSSLEDLDKSRLADYLVHIAGDPQAPQSTPEWEQRLAGLGFMVASPNGSMNEAMNGTMVCTIAGLVLFGRNPRRFLRHAVVRWMSFAGNDKAYQAQDDSIIEGPLLALWHSSPHAGRSRIDLGILERLLERMRPFITQHSGSIGADLRQTHVCRYPLDAVREALVNALVHRDWTRAIDVEVVNYADRLEITSPGSLQNSMTLEKMLAGQRAARNMIMVDVMRDYGYVEARGMGVRRKIVPLTKQYTGKDAQFMLSDDFLRVTIPAIETAGTM